MATAITTSAIGVNSNETVYSASPSVTTEYVYARNQNYLRIKNTGTASLIVQIETDGQRTIHQGMEEVFNVIFQSFKIIGGGAFTAVAKNDIVLMDEVSEVKAAIANLEENGAAAPSDGSVLDSMSFADWNDVMGCTVEQSDLYVRPGTKHTLKQAVTVADTQGRMRRVYPLIDLSEMKDIDYWFYIPDLSKVQWISFAWATDSSYDDRVEMKYYSYYYSDGTKMSLEQGWNHIRIPKELYEVKTAGITDWADALNHYIIVMPSTTDPCDVYWSEIGIDRIQKSYACLCFDDAFAGVYDNIHSWLVEQGIPANLFLPKAKPDTEGHLTTAQLNEMYASGVWEFCNHSVNEPNDLHLATPEVQLAEYEGCRDWMISNGWNRKGSAETFATPGAGLIWDATMIENLKGAGCKFMRTNRNFIANAIPIANMYSIAGYSCSYTTNLADLVSYAKHGRTGSLVLFYGHDPQAVADDGLEISVELIKNAVANFKALGYKFVKLMDWYEEATL